MKGTKHQNNTVDTVEALERVVETLSPTETVHLRDVCRLAGAENEGKAIRAAAALLKKYGIVYKE